MNPNSSLNKMFFFIALVSLTFFPLSNNALALSGKKEQKAADAINLLVEKDYDVKGDGSYTLTLHLKTKIITYKGKKDMADFRVNYNNRFQEVEVIDAKTITKDGKVIKVTQKEIQDISDPNTQRASLFSSSRLKVINFPSVEKGSTIELTLKKRSRLGFWGAESFSLSNPTRLKIVRIKTPKNTKIKFHLPSKEIAFKRKEKGNFVLYQWTGRDLERLPTEAFMPPFLNMERTLVFSNFATWKDTGAFLKKILLKGYKNLRPFELTKKLQESIANRDAFKVYSILQRDMETFPISLFSSSLEFSGPGHVLKRRYGSQMELVRLFFGLLELMGKGPKIIAVNSAGAILEPLKDVPSPGYFDTFIIRANDKFYSFDTKELPPGVTGYHGQLGLDIASGNFTKVKDLAPNMTKRVFDIEMTSPGTYRTRFLQEDLGISGLPLKKGFKYLTKNEFDVRSSMFFHSLFPRAIPIGELDIQGLENTSLKTTIRADFKVKGFLIENNGLYIFPLPGPGFLSRLATLPKDRKTNLFIKEGKELTIDIGIDFPKDTKILMSPSRSRGEFGPISWDEICKMKGRKVSCKRRFDLKRGIVKKGEEFVKFRRLLQGFLSPPQNSIFYSDVVNY